MERLVPSRLVSFAERLVRLVESDDPDVFVDADDAVQTKHASGGRIGDDAFFISYRAAGGETWDFEVNELTLRRLAAGALSTIDVDVWTKPPPAPRARRGDAFALWVEGDRDRVMVRTESDIDAVLASLRDRTRHDAGVAAAVFGSTFGDHVFFAIAPDDTAYLGVVFHAGDRSALEGDDAQVEPLPASFPLLREAVPLRSGDYVSLSSARRALVPLVLEGKVQPEHAWTSAMHFGLLIDLPRVLRERGFTVPLETPFPTRAVAFARTGQSRDPQAVATALVGALVEANAIELTGKRGAATLRERIAALLAARREKERSSVPISTRAKALPARDRRGTS